MGESRIRRIEAGSPLTERELQCLQLAALGNTNAKIGQMLYLSQDTVKGHMGRAFRRLEAKDRANAVYLAVAQGYIKAVA